MACELVGDTGFGQALVVHRETGDRAAEGGVLGNLGNVFDRLGRHTEALDHHWQALAIYRELDDRAGEGVALTNLGTTYGRLGRGGEARDRHREALAICREIGDRVGEGDAELGDMHADRGDAEAAARQWRRAATLFEDLTRARSPRAG